MTLHVFCLAELAPNLFDLKMPDRVKSVTTSKTLLSKEITSANLEWFHFTSLLGNYYQLHSNIESSFNQAVNRMFRGNFDKFCLKIVMM